MSSHCSGALQVIPGHILMCSWWRVFDDWCSCNVQSENVPPKTLSCHLCSFVLCCLNEPFVKLLFCTQCSFEPKLSICRRFVVFSWLKTPFKHSRIWTVKVEIYANPFSFWRSSLLPKPLTGGTHWSATPVPPWLFPKCAVLNFPTHILWVIRRVIQVNYLAQQVTRRWSSYLDDCWPPNFTWNHFSKPCFRQQLRTVLKVTGFKSLSFPFIIAGNCWLF